VFVVATVFGREKRGWEWVQIKRCVAIHADAATAIDLREGLAEGLVEGSLAARPRPPRWRRCHVVAAVFFGREKRGSGGGTNVRRAAGPSGVDVSAGIAYGRHRGESGDFERNLLA